MFCSARIAEYRMFRCDFRLSRDQEVSGPDATADAALATRPGDASR